MPRRRREKELKPYESGVRRAVSHAHGLPYYPLRSLEEARAHPDSAVILEGDWGGQIYLTCPTSRLQCTEAALERLLDDLDSIAWGSNQREGARVYFERLPVGSGVWGGMGGGVVIDGVWVHEEFEEKGLAERIRDVVGGRRATLH